MTVNLDWLRNEIENQSSDSLFIPMVSGSDLGSHVFDGPACRQPTVSCDIAEGCKFEANERFLNDLTVSFPVRDSRPRVFLDTRGHNLILQRDSEIFGNKAIDVRRRPVDSVCDAGLPPFSLNLMTHLI